VPNSNLTFFVEVPFIVEAVVCSHSHIVQDLNMRDKRIGLVPSPHAGPWPSSVQAFTKHGALSECSPIL